MSLKSQFFLLLSLSAVCFVAGYSLSSIRSQLELKRLTNQLNEQAYQALKDRRELEERLHLEVVNATNQFDISSAAVADKFNALSAATLFDPDEWLSEWPVNQNGEPVSDYAGDSSEATSKTECNCNADYRAELQRVQKLYEKELVNSKQCDLNTAQLNSLIDLVSYFH